MNETPTSLGYRMPAEWEPHCATWLTWPHNPETWPKQDKQMVESEFLTIVRNLAIHETIHLLVSNDCLLYTSPSPRDLSTSRMPSSA